MRAVLLEGGKVALRGESMAALRGIQVPLHCPFEKLEYYKKCILPSVKEELHADYMV